MPAGPEEAVLRHSLSRGFLTPAELGAAREEAGRLGQPLLELFDFRRAHELHQLNALFIRSIKSSVSSSVRISGGRN